MKKIVAIGGGENGRLLDDGAKTEYETHGIDQEIIRLTNKEKPHFLFICHAFAFSNEIQDSYFETMKKIYEEKFSCVCKHLRSDELYDKEIVTKKISWADIIYEGGGDTASMIKLWKETKFDKILYNAWNSGKVICGISAGAVCWFHSCNSDIETSSKFETVKCLNWFNLFMTPHANEKGRFASTKEQLKVNKMIGILLPNRFAIEIINNKYRIINSKIKDDNGKKVYATKAYWINNKFIKHKLTNENRFKNIKYLYNKD